MRMESQREAHRKSDQRAINVGGRSRAVGGSVINLGTTDDGQTAESTTDTNPTQPNPAPNRPPLSPT